MHSRRIICICFPTPPVLYSRKQRRTSLHNSLSFVLSHPITKRAISFAYGWHWQLLCCHFPYHQPFAKPGSQRESSRSSYLCTFACLSINIARLLHSKNRWINLRLIMQIDKKRKRWEKKAPSLLQSSIECNFNGVPMNHVFWFCYSWQFERRWRFVSNIEIYSGTRWFLILILKMRIHFACVTAEREVPQIQDQRLFVYFGKNGSVFRSERSLANLQISLCRRSPNNWAHNLDCELASVSSPLMSNFAGFVIRLLRVIEGWLFGEIPA